MKVALILITGDRTDYLENSIKCNLDFINSIDENSEVDIFTISFNDANINTSHKISRRLTFERPNINDDIVKSFPKSKQQSSYDETTNLRISFGHLILFGLIPNSIYENSQLFEGYDYILRSRTDLIFDYDKHLLKNINIDENLITFECFWGGCRNNPTYTNDHFIFGSAKDVLRILSYPIQECIIDNFWNPEQYMTYLFSKSDKKKIEMTTDRYYLLSKDRKSRKFIGYPMESINDSDISFLESINIDYSKLEFTNIYDF